MNPPIRIGTRGSPLAMWQANHVADLLRQAWPGRVVELVVIQTHGDQVPDRPLAEIGGEGVFTRAIQDAVLADQADVAVHSLKDLPTAPVAGLVLAAVPRRGPTGDAFISEKFARFHALPEGARVATGSQRRRAQLWHRRPDLKLVDIRGNVETRLRKLAELELDGLILAQAGLERLSLGHHITEVLDAAWMLPAVGQGALGLECRARDEVSRWLLARLDDPATHQAVTAERSLLQRLGGGCQLPLGVMATVAGDALDLRAAVYSPDGKSRLLGELSGLAERAEEVGRVLGEILVREGAKELLTRKPASRRP